MREVATFFYLEKAFLDVIHSYKPDWMENNSEIDIIHSIKGSSVQRR
jgi:hypothetical protein